MRSARAPLLGLLLLASAPPAAAQPSGDCDVAEIEFWYDLAHADGTSEQVGTADGAREGDSIWFQANGPLVCSGETLALVVWAQEGPFPIVYDYDESTGHARSASADFAYWDMSVDVPECAFAIELWHDETLLDSAEGGDGTCDLSSPGECSWADAVVVGYEIERADGSTAEAETLMDALLLNGDRVQAVLDVGAECEGVVLALSSYAARHEEISYSLHDETTIVVPAGGGRVEVGPTLAPDCTFVVILWLGQDPPIAFLDGAEGGEGECEESTFACGGVHAQANSDGSITLAWDDVAGADGYGVWRTSGGDEPLPLEFVESGVTTYTDGTSVAGETYTYAILPIVDGVPARVCESVEVTAVPFFGAPFLLAVALAGALVAYVRLRRSP